MNALPTFMINLLNYEIQKNNIGKNLNTFLNILICKHMKGIIEANILDVFDVSIPEKGYS